LPAHSAEANALVASNLLFVVRFVGKGEDVAGTVARSTGVGDGIGRCVFDHFQLVLARTGPALTTLPAAASVTIPNRRKDRANTFVFDIAPLLSTNLQDWARIAQSSKGGIMKPLNTSGASIAVAVAALIAAASGVATPSYAEGAKGRCIGANACKGKSDCSANNCAGTNVCKGKGYLEMTKKECDKIPGTRFELEG
jgi:hypothetical protein